MSTQDSAKPARRKWIVRGVLVAMLAALSVFLTRRMTGSTPVEYNANAQPLGALRMDSLPFRNAWGDTMPGESGTLVVPEDRAREEGNHVELAFVRLRSSSPHPLPPIVVLAGGPGTSGIAIGRGSYFYLYRTLRQYADVILLDQRGTGASVPNLQCPNRLGLPTDVSTGIEQAVAEEVAHRAAECARHFRDHGVELAAYQSQANADDIDDLRRALGYQQISLMGHSYGTELAMVYARRHPESVDHLIFVGTVSPDYSLKVPSEVDAEFTGLAPLALADPRVGPAVPDLAALMRSVHQRLRANPVVIKVPLMDAVDDNDPAPLRAIFRFISVFKPNWVMTLGATQLELMMQDRIGGDNWFASFPATYAKLEAGEYRDIGNQLRNFRRRPMPNALLFTTNCATGYTEARLAQALADQGRTIFSMASLSLGRSRAFCGIAGLPALDTAFLAPITSDRPVLFVAGTLDGRTPFANLDEFERRFPNHQSIVVVNGGHTALMDNAIRDGIVAFLQDQRVPTPVETRTVEFDPVTPYRASLADTLYAIVAARGPEAVAAVYDSIVAAGGTADGRYEPGPEPLMALGYRFRDEARPADATAVFALAVAEYPDNSRALTGLGRMQAAGGDTAAARTSFQRALQLDFLNVGAQLELGELAASP